MHEDRWARAIMSLAVIIAVGLIGPLAGGASAATPVLNGTILQPLAAPPVTLSDKAVAMVTIGGVNLFDRSYCSFLQLRGDCVVNGNVYAGKLQVEPTAIFNGQCHMGSNEKPIVEKASLNVADRVSSTNGIKAAVQ